MSTTTIVYNRYRTVCIHSINGVLTFPGSNRGKKTLPGAFQTNFLQISHFFFKNTNAFPQFSSYIG